MTNLNDPNVYPLGSCAFFLTSLVQPSPQDPLNRGAKQRKSQGPTTNQRPIELADGRYYWTGKYRTIKQKTESIQVAKPLFQSKCGQIWLVFPRIGQKQALKPSTGLRSIPKPWPLPFVVLMPWATADISIRDSKIGMSSKMLHAYSKSWL